MTTSLKAYLCIGCPGSGKSTWAKDLVAKNANVVRLCPDDFRAKFGNSESDQSVSGIAFAATRNGMDEALRNGHSVVIDATNMYRKTRKDFINIAKKNGAMTVAVVFEVEKATLVERNINRGIAGGRNVPEQIVDQMLGRYQRPNELEFDEVLFISKLESIPYGNDTFP